MVTLCWWEALTRGPRQPEGHEKAQVFFLTVVEVIRGFAG